ncbi:MAG: DUF4388 domain-containing protein [Desulfuromonadales bacterium]
MSLVGNLEDLGLGEILQIVSLSRKSGVLQLNSRERDGRVIFRDGQVIRAMASTFPENLGDLVLRNGLADMETLKQALVIQQESDDDRRIGDILVSEFGVDREAIETAVREQLEKIVYSFFGWDEGAFSFELGDCQELVVTNLNPLQFMLDQGLNPQWLAMEGSRILDEKRHRGEDVEEQGESLVDLDALMAEVKNEPASQPASDVAKQSTAGDGLYNIGAELLEEMGEVAPGVSPESQQTPGLHLLRGMLQELNNPSLGGGIILLILRFASELMNRAVILLVKDEEIVGLGQFGIELAKESADVRVRNTRLPKAEQHVFTDALQTFVPYHRTPADTEWNSYLFSQLGGEHPAEVFIGPLISEGRVVAVLYGDNLPEQKSIGDTESLEIFLSQAGLAMEKALLERRMMSSRNAV